MDELPPYILFLYVKEYEDFIASFLFLIEWSHKIHSVCCELVRVLNGSSSIKKSQTTTDPTLNPFHLPSLLPLFSDRQIAPKLGHQPTSSAPFLSLSLAPPYHPILFPSLLILWFSSEAFKRSWSQKSESQDLAPSTAWTLPFYSVLLWKVSAAARLLFTVARICFYHVYNLRPGCLSLSSLPVAISPGL